MTERERVLRRGWETYKMVLNESVVLLELFGIFGVSLELVGKLNYF